MSRVAASNTGVARSTAADRLVPLDAEVLRVQRTGKKAIQYGCHFVGLRERDMDVLFGFVMQTQGAQRRTRLPH